MCANGLHNFIACRSDFSLWSSPLIRSNLVLEIGYVPPQRVWFRSENGHRLCPYVFVWNRVSGIEDGFRGNCSSVWTNSSFQFQISKKEGITRECEMNFTKEIFLLAFQSYSWWHDFIYQLGLSLNTENLRPLLKKKSDWNGAYEGKVIKVLINVWNCIFKSSQWIEQCDIPWEFIPFCSNCPYGVGRRNTWNKPPSLINPLQRSKVNKPPPPGSPSPNP